MIQQDVPSNNANANKQQDCPPSSNDIAGPAGEDRPKQATATSTTAVSPIKGHDDELQRLIDEAARNFQQSTTWKEFFDKQRDPRGDWGEVETLPHPAATLLSNYKRDGVPVEMLGEQWSRGQKTAALERGSHKSARQHREFLRGKYTDMVKKYHWVLLPARLVKDHPELRLSPLGVVPKHERRPRKISDYSYFGVNDDTKPLAPQEAMQFGRKL